MIRSRCCAALLCVTALSAAAAQETPTERDSARDVVRKLDSLEKSLDLPALVAKLTGPNSARDQVAARAKELMDTELLALGDDITKHPEIGFEEKRSVQILTDYLKKHDFTVQMGTPGLPTAFVARYTKATGAPNLGVILEYDALRGTKGAFHGDQHSTQGPIGIAAAVAIAEYLTKTKTPGTVTVFGAPGEEMMPPNAKTVMYESKVFDGMDVLVRSHSTSATSRPAAGFGTCCMNIDGVKYTFSGAPAHQLTAWNGRNALTAVIHLFNNIDAMRSNIRPEARIQGVITEGRRGAERRARSARRRTSTSAIRTRCISRRSSQMVDDAARAAALATGTKVKIDHYGQNRDGVGVGSLNEVAFAYMKKYGGHGRRSPSRASRRATRRRAASRARSRASGSARRRRTRRTTRTRWSRTRSSPVGHRGFVVDAQAMAALLFDFATRADYRATVKREFDTIRGLHTEYLEDLKKMYVLPKVPEP